MTRTTFLLATALCMLSACAGPARQPTSALDAVHEIDAAEAQRSNLRRDCRRPQPGFVCVREMRPDSTGQCVCLEADQLRSLGIWPDSHGF